MRIHVPILVCVAFGIRTDAAQAKTPDCSGRWPTNMAFVEMKNAGVAKNEEIDFRLTKTVRLTSERIGKDLFRQVYLVTFIRKEGPPLQVLTISDASSDECSMGSVRVFVVSQELGSQPQAPH